LIGLQRMARCARAKHTLTSGGISISGKALRIKRK
jgi:hypothetical protein